MSVPDHPLAPSLQPHFSTHLYEAANKYRPNCRDLFYYLQHVGSHYDILPLAQAFLQRLVQEAIHRYPVHPGAEEEDTKLSIAADLPSFKLAAINLNNKNLSDCLRQSAPVILTAPFWLQGISSAVTNQEPIALNLFAIYRQLDAAETENINVGEQFQALLMAANIPLPALSSQAFCRTETIDDSLFEFAAAQLAFTHFARVFLAEMLGFTLAYCQSPSLPEVFFSDAALQELHCPTRFFMLRRQLLKAQVPQLEKTCAAYSKLSPKQTGALRQRIRNGFNLYRLLMERCCESLYQHMSCPFSAQQAMLQLLRQKAPAAQGHHRNIRLGGKTLDTWFAEIPFDGDNFLRALLKSPYINQQSPQQSRLLNLFRGDGPMFGILTKTEMKIVHTWLAGLPLQTDQTQRPSITLPSPFTFGLASSTVVFSPDFSNLSNRELYYYLLHADCYPDVLPIANRIVKQVLRWPNIFKRPPFSPYQHDLFNQYLEHIYRQEIDAYQPLQGKPKLSKAAYLWGIEQFAPTILTDGCWLQNIRQLDFSFCREIGKLLFNIYSDEIGNGNIPQNHPHIYHQLLHNQHIKLPPMHSKAFTEHPGFINQAFDLPVYLLAIAQFPLEFLPELLGLNMAIEISGLGKVYLRLADELKYWHIDPHIVNIHTTIDNVASGHAALAKEAIQLHLDEISASQGEAEMQHHWLRIHTGYCSLASAGKRFQIALIYHYLRNRLTPVSTRRASKKMPKWEWL